MTTWRQSSANMAAGYKWKLKQHFRANAFGWRGSALAATRLKQALSEIHKVGRKAPVLAAEGALSLAERLWPALQDIDTSSGALGNATNRAVEQLVATLIAAPVDILTRSKWLDRLYEAVHNDGVDYLSGIQDRWGELCVFTELAHQWADRLVPHVRECWSGLQRCFTKNAIMALSSLLKAGRHDDIADLLNLQQTRWWHYDRFLAESLVLQGHLDAALSMAEAAGRDPHSNAGIRAC